MYTEYGLNIGCLLSLSGHENTLIYKSQCPSQTVVTPHKNINKKQKQKQKQKQKTGKLNASTI